ncbi:type I restriction enzyme HsdR N-terminal domain-containing protein [Clostridium beijerinckii]|uniref:type I restriction enzyme HsdR N-terminal domain-containing protein n=1 Tax=Clostridium beijerinckii TaxID=1520 RepID=UPI00047E57B4|nr:type I restriction enzyme HsdR N-terminal domain-containing protein [Clostridium beijerinckii]
MKNEDLQNLQCFYLNELEKRGSEENIKMLVVKDLLHLLGYKKEWFNCEESTLLGRTDISLILPNNNRLYVETKRRDHKITNKDFAQVCSYMDAHNTEWGIITNGNHYYLLNKSLDVDAEYRVVLEYLLIYKPGFKYSKEQNDQNLKYFSYSRIFQKKSSRYFAYFKEYTINNRSLSNDISFKQYQSANFNFFDYLDNNERICDESLLNPTRLLGYFHDMVSKKQYAKSTLINKCSYISSTLKYLEDCGKLQTKHFNNFNSENFLSEIITKYCNKDSKEISPLTLAEANSLLNYYSQNKSSYSRNKLLFKLYLFICPSIESIQNLKIDDFRKDDDELYLKINSYEFKLPNSLINDYNEYINFKNTKELTKNFKYLFYTFYGKKCNKMSSTTIMSIINDSFNNINDISPERKKQLNISTIQKSVISLMLTKGFTTEQISSFTGLTVGTIYNYFDKKTLKNIAKKSNDLLMTKHPYQKILF